MGVTRQDEKRSELRAKVFAIWDLLHEMLQSSYLTHGERACLDHCVENLKVVRRNWDLNSPQAIHNNLRKE